MTTPRLRVLFVTNRATWPAYPGFKARAGLLLECLARDHDVTAVVVLPERQDEPAIPPHVHLAASATLEVPKPSKPWAVLRWATLGVPMPFATVQWERARRPVAEVLAGSVFDLVVAIDATTVRFLPDDLPAPLVVDFDDLQDKKIAHRRRARADHPTSGLRARLEVLVDVVDQRRWQRIQERLLDRAAMVTVCSLADVAELGRANVGEVANGYRGPARPIWEPTVGGPPTLLYVGDMSYRPNIEAASMLAERVLPLVRERIPDCRVRIVGRGGDRIRHLGAVPGVEIVGPVPDVVPELAAASICAVPLLSGGGTRIKILEAFAYGLPVVSTTVGAEGLAVVDGRDLLIADEPEGLAEAVCDLIGDPERARRMSAAAHHLYATTYTPDAIAEQVRAVVDGALGAQVRS